MGINKRLLAGVAALFCIVLVGGCVTKEPSPPPKKLEPARKDAPIPPVKPRPNFPTLSSRLAPQWLDGKQSIQAKNVTIYYEGTSNGRYSDDQSSWSGTVTGDLLALNPNKALFCPAGTLVVSPDGHFTCQGRSLTTLKNSAGNSHSWEHLLNP